MKTEDQKDDGRPVVSEAEWRQQIEARLAQLDERNEEMEQDIADITNLVIKMSVLNNRACAVAFVEMTQAEAAKRGDKNFVRRRLERLIHGYAFDNDPEDRIEMIRDEMADKGLSFTEAVLNTDRAKKRT